MASLFEGQMSSVLVVFTRRIPVVNVALDQLEVAFPEVTDDLEWLVEVLLVDFHVLPCRTRSIELE